MLDRLMDMAVEGEWRPLISNSFTTMVGPFYVRRDGERLRYRVLLEPRHDNSLARPHGGMVMAFTDDVFGWYIQMTRKEGMVTVSFDCQFIGGANIGSYLEVEPEEVQRTRSFSFMRGTCMSEGKIIARCSGVWKKFTPKAEKAEQ